MPETRATTLGSCVPNLEPATHRPSVTNEVGPLAGSEIIQQDDFALADRPGLAPSRFTSPRRTRTSVAGVAVAATIAALVLAGCGSSSHHTKTIATNAAKITAGGYTAQVFASGAAIQHHVPTSASPSGKASIYQPDDLTKLGSDIWVAFQNNVGPDGTPASHVSTSTIVEFSSSGTKVAQWDLTGHADGIAADTSNGQVYVTTNEDANAHLFALKPGSSKATSYSVPSSLPHKGGLDAISFWHGKMLISASAPGTTGGPAPPQNYPAVYVVTLNSSAHTASFHTFFTDMATAKHANSGKTGTTKLALTDPDSNEVVPSYAPRFGGQFMLTSQGDGVQIFSPDTSGKNLSVLANSQASPEKGSQASQTGLDDSAWASGSSGTLYITDNGTDIIWKVTGPFKKGEQMSAVSPCDANSAPMSCLAKKYVGEVNMNTGVITEIPITSQIQPKGLLWVP
ncbi:MAG TPA: hypothetical protein VFB39_18000 [Solirubrobacteraceae bacterium]|nr:hypothetical protein [Solirubrobacteraceae bacterium]